MGKKIKAALLGAGTVGTGVYKLFERRSDVMEQTVGAELELKKILVHSLGKKRAGIDESLLTDDWNEILNDDEIRIVIEVMGGIEPAKTYILDALHAGKHVVTANKDLIAVYGRELLDAAEEQHCDLLFEAAVAGAIPIIRPLKQCLAANEISEVLGIVNGTTNYILTKMDKEGETFESALKEAQDLGYAERNPEADVEGHDTCRKIAILTAMATGHEVDYEDIHTEGITSISDVDFKYAEKLGTSVKLFGSSRIKDGEIHAWVAPVMIGKDHPLYSVSDVFNGILVKGNMLGTSMFYGSGAGMLPTASAVIADIIEAVQNRNRHVEMGWDDSRLAIAPIETSSCRFFIRIKGIAEERLAEVQKVFGDVTVIELDHMDEFAVVTDVMTEAEYEKKAKELSGIRQRIRAEV